MALGKTVVDLAKRFIDLWWKEQGAKKVRKATAEKLLEFMHRHHIEEIVMPFGSDKVVLESSPKKIPTKTEIVEAFGRKGEAFWEALPAKTSVWLTVKPAVQKKESAA